MENLSPTIKCVDCEKLKDCRDSASSWFFLFIGLIATLSVRVVNIAMDYNPFLAKLAWYIGIVGFFIYFLNKYRRRRLMSRFLVTSDIIQKLRDGSVLSAEDADFLSSVLCSLRSHKDSVNYFFIFFTSALALLVGLYQDFLR